MLENKINIFKTNSFFNSLIRIFMKGFVTVFPMSPQCVWEK
jgi:hypothetical protein